MNTGNICYDYLYDLVEIKYITKACNITDDCFEYLLNYIKIGMTEKQIASAIERFFR